MTIPAAPPDPSSAARDPAVPTFAVVGRVNRGKSSIIATLAEEDSIAISPLPGTTRHCTTYDVQLGGRTLFRLVDTPGFEEASRALQWMLKSNPQAHERKARVRAFIDAFADSDEFCEERELLSPILEGAAILYVVDATMPFRENIMAEIEILRFTGQPRMALVNRSAGGPHVQTWHDALEPAFSAVRNFDAHHAGFQERIRLLTLFRELSEQWRKPLDEAVSALELEQRTRIEESAALIANLLVRATTHTVLVSGGRDGLNSKEQAAVEIQFFDALRRLETEERESVERLYRHHHIQTTEGEQFDRPLFTRDLFSERVWSSMGLSAGQLLTTYSLAGATAGGTIDAMVGGASLMAGAVIGAAIGGAAALWQLGQRALTVTAVDTLVGRLSASANKLVDYRVGPHQHPNFPFIVLDRALLHYRAIATRAHARNAAEALFVDASSSPSRGMSTEQRKRLTTLFDKLRKRPSANHDDLRAALTSELRTLTAEFASAAPSAADTAIAPARVRPND